MQDVLLHCHFCPCWPCTTATLVDCCVARGSGSATCIACAWWQDALSRRTCETQSVGVKQWTAAVEGTEVEDDDGLPVRDREAQAGGWCPSDRWRGRLHANYFSCFFHPNILSRQRLRRRREQDIVFADSNPYASKLACLPPKYPLLFAIMVDAPLP